MGRWASWPPGSEPVATRSREKGLSASYRMPVRLEAEWRIAETEVVPGARIAIRTELVLAPVEVQLFLRTRKRTPASESQDVVWRVRLFPPGTSGLREARRVICSPGRGRLAMRVTDAAGHALTEEVAVGPRDGVRGRTALAFSTPVELSAWVAPWGGPGTGLGHLAVRGEATFTEGIALEWNARPGAAVKGGRLSAPARIALAAPGKIVQARERTLEQRSPAEGWVSAGFVDERGHELSDRRLLGRYLLP